MPEVFDNPRYISYAQAHGKTPAEMMEHDRATWPGGRMTGFILWMGNRKEAFWKKHPEAFLDRIQIWDQDAWTRFLQTTPAAQEEMEER